MHFVVLCLDKAKSLAIGQDRAAHRTFLAENAAAVKLGGPFPDESGQMCGSMLILSCVDEAATCAPLSGDPYDKGGLSASVVLRAFRPTVGISLT